MIHYHGVPLSGDFDSTRAIAGHHAMVSFAHKGCIEVTAELAHSFVLDNGAFSAWKQGGELDVDGFMEWATTWLKHPGCDWAVIPDVIDGSEEENDAMLTLGEKDGRWVPVWHLHESIDRAVQLANEWPRICFGSSGEYATIGTKAWWHRIAEVMDEITDEEGVPITKIHGLRMLDPGLFSYIPFASADSTNVARNMGVDIRWTGPYVPRTRYMRALVIMDRVEGHACAARWNKDFSIKQGNLDLLG